MLGLQNQHSVQLSIFFKEQIMLLSESSRCATVVVQFLQCSLHCAMWPVYICKGLLGQYYCIVCLFVCLLCELRVLLEFGAIVVSLGHVHRNLKSSFQPFSFWYGR